MRHKLERSLIRMHSLNISYWELTKKDSCWKKQESPSFLRQRNWVVILQNNHVGNLTLNLQFVNILNIYSCNNFLFPLNDYQTARLFFKFFPTFLQSNDLTNFDSLLQKKSRRLPQLINPSILRKSVPWFVHFLRYLQRHRDHFPAWLTPVSAIQSA